MPSIIQSVVSRLLPGQALGETAEGVLGAIDVPTAAGLAADPAFTGAFAPFPSLVSVNVLATLPQATVGTWPTYIDPGFAGGGVRYSSGAVDESISYDLILGAGTWSLVLFHRADDARGIYSITIAGTPVGTIDGYASPTADTLSEITGISVASPGLKRVTLTMATKNASSSAYYGGISHLAFTRTGD